MTHSANPPIHSSPESRAVPVRTASCPAAGIQMTSDSTIFDRSTHRTGPGRSGSPCISGAGFTLIELMISIALVVFLIFGINQVFLYTSQAVGTGEAINTGVRDSRAAQSVFAGDFSGMVTPGSSSTESACLIIQNSQVYAFSSAADQAGSQTPNDPEQQDLTGTGYNASTPGDLIAASTYNSRNHRTDSISFFARDLFHRQTGNLGTYADNLASTEAWIWYGHVMLPDNSGNYQLPGAGTRSTNPNNVYGSQFVLGREAIVLKDKTVDTYGYPVTDLSGNSQRFFDRTSPYPTAISPASDLQPLHYGTTAADSAVPLPAIPDTNTYYLQDSRFDLAATSIAGFKNKLVSYLGNASLAATAPLWWTQMMTPTNLSQGQNFSNHRFHCNPFVPKPIQSDGMAQASPYFLGGCSQFTVEFAGDYLVQNNNPLANSGGIGQYGAATAVGSDGQIDYVLVTTNGVTRKQVIWYGLPRTTNGNGAIAGVYGDVMTVYDYIQYFNSKYSTNLTDPYIGTVPGTTGFEKVLPTYNSGPSGMTNGSQYICAFGPNDRAPKLIRITITITDPSGRIPQGLTYQYVYTVPPQVPQQ
jgi:type II secretory pathway pseudopilin PulG